MIVIGTMKIMLLTTVMKHGIVIGSVLFQDGSGPPQVMEYRIEGCGDLGNQYVTRGGWTSQWRRDGGGVADQIATHVCGKVEAAHEYM